MEKVPIKDLPYNAAYPWVLPCAICKHRKGTTCKAFPDGIPRDLLRGVRLHIYPVEKQKGEYTLKLK